MSTTPPPTPPPPFVTPPPSLPPPGSPGPRAATRTRFWDWLSRLDLRRADDRWLGGVAGGVADRLGVDPVLVRVAFVVLGLLAGAGALVYAAAWLLLPDRAGRIEARAVLTGEVSAAAVGALALLVLSVVVPDPWRWWSRGPLFTGGDVASFLLVAAVVAAAVALLPRLVSPRVRRGRAASGGQGAGADGMDVHGVGVEAPSGAHPATVRPPRAPRRPAVSAAVTAAVVGLALLLATATWLLFTTPSAGDLLGAGTPGSLPHLRAVAAAASVAAAVIGLALVVVGVSGRRGGGLGFWGVLAALTAVAFAVVPTQARGQVVGSAYWHPASAAVAERGYALGAGEASVDLSELPAAVGGFGRPAVHIPVRHGFGHLTVVVPQETTVTVRSRLLAGQVDTRGHGWHTRGQADGLLPDVTVRADGPLTHAAVVPYVVDVQGLAGEITVERVAS